MRVSYVAPTPNEQREARVRTLLHTIDPQLDIKWRPYVVKTWDVNESLMRYEGRYALVYSLAENDPGRRHVQQTGAEEAFEPLGWFCTDMTLPMSTPVPCDEMEPKIRTFLGEIDARRVAHVARFMDVIGENATMLHSREADAHNEAVQRMLDRRRSAFGIPYISQYTGRQ